MTVYNPATGRAAGLERAGASMNWVKRWSVAAATLVAVGAGALSLAPKPAAGYAVEVHKDFFDLAFGGRDAGRQVTPPTAADLEAFRRFVWERGQQNAELRRRWPTFEAFDAAAFKELLQLNPGKQVVAIDHVPSGRGTDVRTVVREGSVDPDNDLRNQDRLWVDADGQVALDPFGRAVPYDPRTTWFGGLTGTPSQFDAHGATLRTGEKGDGILTAFRHPEQFARPPVALGSAPEFSETYTELAMIARLWGGPGSEWLALTFGGNNLHGIEDLGNQIHTTLIGIPQFFIDAKITYYQLKLKRAFRKKVDPADAGFVPPTSLTMDEVNHAMRLIKAGQEDQVDPRVRFALGKEPKGLPSDTEIGISIIGNHHRLLEDFVEKQYLAGAAAIAAGDPSGALPEVRRLIQRARAGDAEFERRARAALASAGLGRLEKGQTPYGKVIADLMIEHSAPEAAPIYKAIRAISKKELKRDGVYDAELGHDVLDFVTDTGNEHTDRIWELSGRAFARVVTAIRLWDEVYHQETDDVAPGSDEAKARANAIVDRMVARQLERLEAARQRREAYLAEKRAEWDEANRPGILDRIKGWFGR